MLKNKLQSAALITMIIITPFLITAYAFRIQAFNQKHYLAFYEQHGIYAQFQARQEVDDNTILLLEYLQERKELDTDFFNEKEKLHLADVKRLISALIITSYVSLALFLTSLFFLKRQQRSDHIAKGLFYGGLLSLLLIGIFLVSLLLDFKAVFLNFHHLFFTNDLWLLDPATDNLILLFPSAFFYITSLKILASSIIASAFFAVFGLALGRKTGKSSFFRRKNQKV